jgi:hypothetical protein
VDLESKMLESVSFEFNIRHPLRLIFKILQLEFNFVRPYDGVDPQSKLKTLVTGISVDLNYTFALLKQTTSSLAIACIELGMRLQDRAAELEVVFPPLDLTAVVTAGDAAPGKQQQTTAYERFQTTRANVNETLMDLLDLYATHRAATSAGPLVTLDDVTKVRLQLNELADLQRIPRYQVPPRVAAAAAAEEDERRAARSKRTEGDGGRRAGGGDTDAASPGEATNRTGSRGSDGGGRPTREAVYALVLRRAAAEQASRAAANSSTSPAAHVEEPGEQATNGVLRRAGGVDVEPLTPEAGNVVAVPDGREGSAPREEQIPVRRFVLLHEDAVAEEQILASFFVPRKVEEEREEEVEDGWEADSDEEEGGVRLH